MSTECCINCQAFFEEVIFNFFIHSAENWHGNYNYSDWYSKKIVENYGGLQAKTWHWLTALNKTVDKQFSTEVRNHDIRLMSDNGPQPTSINFILACKNMEIKQVDEPGFIF